MSIHNQQAHKVFALPPRTIATYYWIQDFIKEHGRGPYYYEIGSYLGGSDNHISARNRGIRLCSRLEDQGFLKREGHGRGSRLLLTDKQMNAENISRSTVAD